MAGGHFRLVLVQAFCTALTFSWAAVYSYSKLRVSEKAVCLMLLAYCLLPVYPASVQGVSKDALSAWIFVLFAIQLTEIIRTRGKALRSIKFLAAVIVVSLLCCLTKKVNVYVVVFSLAGALIALRKRAWRLVIPIVCAVLLMFVGMPAFHTSVNAAPSGKQEMLSMPFQMSARYVRDHGDDITEEEYEVLSRVLDMETIAEVYNPIFADPVKGYHQRGADDDYISYLRVWFRQGLRHPLTYIQAFNCMLASWFSWYEYAPLMNMDWRSQHNTEMIPEWVPVRTFSSVTADQYQAFYHALYRSPLFMPFMSFALYAAIIPAFAIGTTLKKKSLRGAYWAALLPVLFSIALGCWLAPAGANNLEGTRYLYPATYTAPLTVMWCLYVAGKWQRAGRVQDRGAGSRD